MKTGIKKVEAVNEVKEAVGLPAEEIPPAVLASLRDMGFDDLAEAAPQKRSPPPPLAPSPQLPPLLPGAVYITTVRVEHMLAVDVADFGAAAQLEFRQSIADLCNARAAEGGGGVAVEMVSLFVSAASARVRVEVRMPEAVALMERCWDENFRKRPTAEEVYLQGSLFANAALLEVALGEASPAAAPGGSCNGLRLYPDVRGRRKGGGTSMSS